MISENQRSADRMRLSSAEGAAETAVFDPKELYRLYDYRAILQRRGVISRVEYTLRKTETRVSCAVFGDSSGFWRWSMVKVHEKRGDNSTL